LVLRGERYLDKQIDVVTLLRKLVRFEALLKSMTSPLQWKLAAHSKKLVLNSDSSTQSSSSDDDQDKLLELLDKVPATD